MQYFYLLYRECQQHYNKPNEGHRDHDATYHVIRIIRGICNKGNKTLTTDSQASYSITAISE